MAVKTKLSGAETDAAKQVTSPKDDSTDKANINAEIVELLKRMNERMARTEATINDMRKTKISQAYESTRNVKPTHVSDNGADT